MYIPPYFVNADRSEALAFIKRFPFGLLISNGVNGPVSTHLPFIFHESDGKLWLTSHLSADNEQASLLENSPVLAVFSEPHAYISPALYDRKENVPTWNYVAVHCRGNARVLKGDDNKVQVLERTISVFEPTYLEQWRGLSAKYKAGLLGELVAFEIEVTELQAGSKLSQNKSRAERERIAAQLSDSTDAAAAELAAYMKAQMERDHKG